VKHTSIREALDDLLLNTTIDVPDAVHKHFSADFRQRTNGAWMTRDDFTAHMTALRDLVEQATITVHEELFSGRLYAERHTIAGARKDGAAGNHGGVLLR